MFPLLFLIEILLIGCFNPIIARDKGINFTTNFDKYSPKSGISLDSVDYLNGLLKVLGEELITVSVIEDSRETAFIVDSTTIAITCPLILITNSDEDLMFILAHEASHIKLGHLELNNVDLKKLELEADKLAAKWLKYADVDLFSVRKLFYRLGKLDGYKNNDFSYPTPLERLMNLASFYSNSYSSFTGQGTKSISWVKLIQECKFNK